MLNCLTLKRFTVKLTFLFHYAQEILPVQTNVTFLVLQIQKSECQGHEIQMFPSGSGRMQTESKTASENVLAKNSHCINVQIIAIFFSFFPLCSFNNIF